MKKERLISIFAFAITFMTGVSVAQACPESNSTMQVVEGNKDGQKFCAIRSTNDASPAIISKDETFTSDKLYILGSGLYVGDNEIRKNNENKITLTIEAGTKILGQSEKAYMQINRGAKIVANGTRSNPIVMTTAKTENRTRGSWGGLIINGSAPVNGCSDDVAVCELKGEGLTSYSYGGPNPKDDSGVLNYVVVEFAGNEITPDNELNGIAFQGVGNKTEVDYIQVHMNSDDGVEFFGGTVNVKHVVLTGNKDDSLDWTSGWNGSAQFVIVEQYADAGNMGIEADNFSKRHNAAPRSEPTLANMTFIGSDKSKGAKGGSGILLRRGTGAKIFNTYITGFSDSCFDIDDAETFRYAEEEGGITLNNTVFNCEVPFTSIEADEPWAIDNFVMTQEGNKISDLNLNKYLPAEGLNKVEATEVEGLETTDFVGALKDSSDNWFTGWTVNKKN